MIINSIEISNLYGYLNKKVDFNKNINLLVGINGSGKTSILNLVNWLLTPSFPNLCVTEYEQIILNFSFKSEEFELISKQNDKEVTIDVKNLTKNIDYNQVQADFKIHPKKITRNHKLRQPYFSQYEGLEPEDDEEDTWHFLFETLDKPIVIGLDRNLYTEEGSEISYVEDIRTIRKNITRASKSIKSPLERVANLSGQEYQKYKNRILDLNKRLNEKMLLSSFDETLTRDNLGEILGSPKISLQEVQSLEVKVKEYFRETLIDKNVSLRQHKKRQENALMKIEGYFKNLKAVLSQLKGQKEDVLDILYITNLNQFKKIKELIKEFEDFESKSKRFFEPLSIYLNTINSFLKDSAKELYFDKNSSNLKFKVLDKQGNVLEENRDIETLSSGEKQILILFTYIKFNDQLGKLFIIDEPELSLHPKWQESFLDGIEKIMPSNTQLLFATHSPAIVGQHKDYCKVLLPY